MIVPDDQLSLAIGKEGQNARLAARLTGWRVDIRSETEFAEEEAEGGFEEEDVSGRCAAILSNGKRCPNASLPASRYCGLPAHQALAEQDDRSAARRRGRGSARRGSAGRGSGARGRARGRRADGGTRRGRGHRRHGCRCHRGGSAGIGRARTLPPPRRPPVEELDTPRKSIGRRAGRGRDPPQRSPRRSGRAAERRCVGCGRVRPKAGAHALRRATARGHDMTRRAPAAGRTYARTPTARCGSGEPGLQAIVPSACGGPIESDGLTEWRRSESTR